MQPIKLTLRTMPPSINATYKRGKNSFYKSQEAKDAQEAMAWEARIQYRGKPLTGSLRLKIAFYWTSSRRDVDSSVKAVCDALQGIIYENDNQIYDLHLSKTVDRAAPRIEIEIESLE